MKKEIGSTGMDRRTFIKLSSGSVLGISANWFLPRMSWGKEEEIFLGGLCEMSGFVSPMGTEQAQGIELAVEMYNQSGGLLGKKIRLLIEDTESKKEVGLARARRLVERHKATFLTGIIFSAISMAVQDYIREKKVLFVNSGSGNDELVEPPYCGRYFFKSMGSQKASTLGVREPAKRIGPKWYLLADNYSWGKLSAEYAKRSLKLARADIEIVGEDYPNPGEANYAPFITKIMAAKPDGLFIATFGTGWLRTVKQAREMGLKCHIHHSFWSYADALAAGDAVLGMTTVPPFLPNDPTVPRASVFAEAFKKKHGRYPGYAAAAGFNGVECIMEAAKVAGTTDVEAIIDTMANMKYKNSIVAPEIYFRKADHLLISGIYTVEVIRDPKFTYGFKVLHYDPNPTIYLKPEGQTGCEQFMNR